SSESALPVEIAILGMSSEVVFGVLSSWLLGSAVSTGSTAWVVHAETFAIRISRRHLPVVMTSGMLAPLGTPGSENLPASSVTVEATGSPASEAAQRPHSRVLENAPGSELGT